MDLEGVNWTHMAQDRVQWQPHVNTVMNLQIPQKVEKFLTTVVSFSHKAWMKTNQKNTMQQMRSVRWAECILLLLSQIKSGHTAQSQTYKCCQLLPYSQVRRLRWAALAIQGNMIRPHCTELLRIKMSTTTAKLQLKALAEGYTQLFIVIGCCTDQWRLSFIRKWNNYSWAYC